MTDEQEKTIEQWKYSWCIEYVCWRYILAVPCLHELVLKSYHGSNHVIIERKYLNFLKNFEIKWSTEKFEFLDFIAQGAKVVVEGKNKGTVISTGRVYEHDWVMIFELKDKKIIKNQHFYDTADLVKYFYWLNSKTVHIILSNKKIKTFIW